LQQGLPAESIIVENEAQNTGENFIRTEALLKQSGHHFHKFIIVQKPYSERRMYAAGKKQWPNKTLIMASPPVTYEDYLSSGIPKKRIINTMVGDLYRIKFYPAKGFQIPQQIPPEVWEAGERLIKLGFNQRLIHESII